MGLVLCIWKSQATGEGCKFSLDIMEEILVRLDAKSVSRCKCVSKSWLSLISSPSFMNRHHKQQVPRTLLLLDDPETGDFLRQEGFFSVRNSEIFDQISAHVFPPLVIDNIVWRRYPLDLALAGSQNAVLCLFEKRYNGVYLWNPAIKKLKKLPSSPISPKDPVVIHSIYGFGYEPTTNDFKVVAVSARRQWGSHDFFIEGEQVGVYSLGSNSWTSMQMPDLFSCLVDTSALTSQMRKMFSIVLCGSIHWLLGLGRQWKVESIAIVAFDLSTEEFKLIDAPMSVVANKVESISVLSGCLSLLTFDRPGLIEIWVMEKYGAADSWTKHLCVDLVWHPLPSFQSNFFRPRGVLHNGNLLLDCKEADDDLAVMIRRVTGSNIYVHVELYWTLLLMPRVSF